ncbi:hypothetical protein EJD97_008987 [Solanum chilense]|uniref:Uncharacterized protein n=1 Tax=Solanum chilense TaxID=4083 RepID=A0A6N2CFR7_SOLCI|nr:hypothetical protein EJD97_008987 [Solanum chilense]
MNTRRMTTRMLEEERMNEEIPLQVKHLSQDGKDVQGAQVAQVHRQSDHVPNVEGGNGVAVLHSVLTNPEIRENLLALSHVVTTQANLSMMHSEYMVDRTMTSRLRYFMRLNPSIILGNKTGKEPQ